MHSFLDSPFIHTINRYRTYLTPKTDHPSRWLLISLIFVAIGAGITVRFLWDINMQDTPGTKWLDELMLTTNDGYLYATRAKMITEGAIHGNSTMQYASMFSADGALLFFTWLVAKITPFSFETIILHTSTVISSLIVIPIILIGRSIGSTWLGFFAAIITVVGRAYLDRTRAGYFDTDTFSLLAPILLLYLLVRTISIQRTEPVLLAALFTIIMPFFYGNSGLIGESLIIAFLAYTTILYHRENFAPAAVLIMSAALLNYPMAANLQIALIVGTYLLCKFGELSHKHLSILAVVSLIAVIPSTQFFSDVADRVTRYADRGGADIAGNANDISLTYLDVTGTIAEAQTIQWGQFAQVVTGNEYTLILSVIGFAFLILWRPAMVALLPFAGIGFFAFSGGERFATYFVPVAAFGLAYLFMWLARWLPWRATGLIAASGMTLLTIWPSLQFANNYNPGTVFNTDEVRVLDALATQKSGKKDYVIAWWDYGFPVNYYSGRNTIIDGANHTRDNFLVSKILSTDSQLQAANLARLTVETKVKMAASQVSDALFLDKEGNAIDPTPLLESLRTAEYRAPKKSREVFLYLPHRMMTILNPVRAFSDRDLTTGQPIPRTFYKTQDFTITPDRIEMSDNLTLFSKEGALQTKDGKTKINSYIEVHVDDNYKTHVKKQVVDENSTLSIIYLKTYGTMLVVDQEVLNSVFFKLFYFESFDPEL
ncbi:MAG: hypothetical protein HN842_05585, partial [Gammaproteobacteria bacterium]|nr:hypothetical protein [Gammaproteobacteria bacterium]